MKTTLPAEVTTALAQAGRAPGWNNRPDTVRRFDLANCYGHEPCALYVVPFVAWAYRRQRKAIAAWQAQRAHDMAESEYA